MGALRISRQLPCAFNYSRTELFSNPGPRALFVSAGNSRVPSISHEKSYSASSGLPALFVSAGNSRVLSTTHEQRYSAILGLRPSSYQQVIPVCLQFLMKRATQHPRAFLPSSYQRVIPVCSQLLKNRPIKQSWASGPLRISG